MTRKKQKGPAPVGEALQQFLQRSGLNDRIEEAAVVPEWPGLVGEAISAATTPMAVNNGTLFVSVRSSAWMMELKLMEAEILRRLNAGRKHGRIEKIRFLMAE
jgi:predicted nucleic acid-binding Zn ribbon protein